MADTTVGKGAKLEDSNIANYGSKMHKDAKLAAAQSEPAWENAGKKVGIQVWRIEKFKVVAWPKNQYGSFYSGDSYIILRTYKNPEKESLLYDVHFWLGSKTSQDEQGTAAYKTVELDDLLGDLPVQYREVEGEESDEFLHCFDGKIKTMEGGIESGFNIVKPETYVPRLLHVKGKKNLRVSQVETKASSLNAGDVFILDNGLMIYQWQGPSCGMFERRKAAEIVQGLRDERQGRAATKTIAGLDDEEEFWTILGGKPASLNPATADDVKVVEKRFLFKLSDASGTLEKKQIWEADCKGKAPKAEFKSDDVFILDLGDRVGVWVGNGASKEERRQAVKHGLDFVVGTGRPANTPISRISEGREPAWFKACVA